MNPDTYLWQSAQRSEDHLFQPGVEPECADEHGTTLLSEACAGNAKDIFLIFPTARKEWCSAFLALSQNLRTCRMPGMKVAGPSFQHPIS